jgi:hypothetical protein
MPAFPEAEFISREKVEPKINNDTVQNRATRLLFIITALCIISFTAGLVLGIQFNNGDRELVDKQTISALAGFKNKMGGLTESGNNAKQETPSSYPREQFPFVILIGEKIPTDSSESLISYFSSRGHRVIKLKQQNGMSLFIGPYENEDTAKLSLKKIQSYGDIASGITPQIIKRI